MKRIFTAILALAALTLSVSVFAAESGNLIVNPSAENGISGWTDTTGTWSASNYYKPQRGSYYFFAGVCAESVLYQDIDISSYNANSFKLGGYLGGDLEYGQDDESILTVEFYDSGSNKLNEFSVKRTNGNEWAYYETAGNVPSDAKTARILLKSIRIAGNDNDGYFDNLSFTLNYDNTAAPPPSTPVSSVPGNLLVNPSAENGISGWTDTTGTWSASNYYKPQHGSYYFFAGVCAESVLYQDIDISSYNARSFKLGGYLGGDLEYDQDDESILTVEFYDSGSNKLNEFSVKRTNGNEWAYYETTGNIPSGAKTARVLLKSIRIAGNDNDGYFDNLSFTLSADAVAEAAPKTTEKPTESTTQKPTEKPTKEETKAQPANTSGGDQGGGKNTVPQTVPFTQTSSPWAQQEMQEAYNNGLIPDVLIDKDLRENVSRAEFASIAVSLYEGLSGSKLSAGAALPFNDTAGVENIADIQKAYSANIAVGTGANTFAPYTSINREQLVTMLCRAIKKYKFPEWTIATDNDYVMAGSAYKKFADDADISDFARDSVYFMSNMGIVKGIDETHFAPKAITDEQTANGYAIATREQAIAISLRIFKRSDMM